MPRYVSPGRTPSPSRSPSRTTSRGRRTYTDGVYTPSPSPSPPPPAAAPRSAPRSASRTRSRSRSRARSTTAAAGRSLARRARSLSSDGYYYSDEDDDRRSRRTRARTRSRTRSRSTARGGRLSSILDTSESTGKEKAANVAKTSLVMLGAIGAAAVAAHKFWPKGVTYGDKDDWELARKKEEEEREKKKKLKGKLQEGRDALEGRRGAGSGGSGSGGGGGDGSRDRDRERYLRERRRERPRLPRSMDGGDGAAFWDRRARMPSQGRYVAAYHDNDDDHNNGGYPPRRIEAAPVPQPLPLPPPAPAPPRSFADSAPLVVPAGTSRRESENRGPGRGRYYIDKDTIVVPSSGEKAYVIQRDAPPGQRLRERETERDRDGAYYR